MVEAVLKDEALRGTVKEAITQVSRSKKVAVQTGAVDEDGKPMLQRQKESLILRSRPTQCVAG